MSWRGSPRPSPATSTPCCPGTGGRPAPTDARAVRFAPEPHAERGGGFADPLPKFKEQEAAIENIDYRTPRGLRKTQVLELAQNRWITAHQCVLITGPSGAGKSYLAQALGLNACRSGFSVQYARLPTLLAQFVQARAQGTYDRLLKRLSKLALLVIDDFGLATLNEIERQDLLEAIEERYGTGATLVTSQLPIADWHEYLGGGRLADAILDRLVHNAHRIDLSSKESMRKAAAA